MSAPTTAATAIVRTIPAIALDLITTRQRLRCLMADTLGREPNENEDRLWDDLDARETSLETEIAAAVLRETGVTADVLREVL